VLPARDAASAASRHYDLWSRMRARGRTAPDTGWDRDYRALLPPPLRRRFRAVSADGKVIGAAAGVLLPVLTAALLTRRLAPSGARVAIVVPIAGIAAGLASAFAFALLTSGLHARSWFLAADAGIWTGLAGFAFLLRRTHHPAPSHRHPAPRRRPIACSQSGVGVAILATLAIALVWFTTTSGVYPPCCGRRSVRLRDLCDLCVERGPFA